MNEDFSLRKAERLRRKDDFQKVYSRGKSFEDDNFRLYVLHRLPTPPHRPRALAGQACLLREPSCLCVARRQVRHFQVDGQRDGNRIGFVVGKKTGKAAKRNRAKRLLREAYRLNKGKLKKGLDLVLVARRGVSELNFPEVEKEILGLFKKAGLLE